MRKRRTTRAALLTTAVIAIGTFGVASASTPPDSGAPAASAPAGSTPAGDPCAAEETAATEPVASEAPATEAAGTEPAATEAPATEAPVATEAPAPTEPRETVPPAITELDPTTAIDINEQPRDALQQGGEIRLAVASLADNWNPYNPLGNQVDFKDILEPMSYYVWKFAADGTASLDTNYVLESSTSDATPGQPFTVTYKLNPDAHWNNGDPIDVGDYQQFWRALNGIDNPDFPNVAPEGFDRITSIEQGADKFEVVITFDDVYPDYQNLFSNLTPAESYADLDTYVGGWTELNMDWFTGPFILDSIDTSQGILTEVPNPNWWGDAPLLDKIIFRVVSLDAVPTSYGNGELDAFDIGPDPNGFQIANTTPGGTVRAAAGPLWRHITFNTQAGLIADQTIRQAIVRSLDRADIGSSDLAGIPWPAQPLNNHVFVENQAGYVDNAGDYGYDPERASADLEAAGWVAGADGIREKDGQRLSVKFSRLVGVPVSENEAQLVQAQLAEVGIEVQIVDVPVADFSNVLDNRDFELIAFTWSGTPFPFQGIQQIFGNCSDSNYSSSYIPGLDELVDQIAVTADAVERTALANQVDVMLWDEVTTLPLYQRPDLWAVNENIANYGAFGFQTPRDWTSVGFAS